MNDEAHRGTGRTSRMLEAALEMAKKGPVTIVAANKNQASLLRQLATQANPVVSERICIITSSAASLDIKNKSTVSNRVPVFFDHFASEQIVANVRREIEEQLKIIETHEAEAHRWDKAPVTT